MLKKLLYLSLLSALALLALIKSASPSALAAPAAVTFTVDTTRDLIDPDTSDGLCPVGSCSLRAAIMQADVMGGTGATIIVPSGVYTLTRPAAGADGPENGDLNLTTPASGDPVITISGAGAASTFIDANQIDRVLAVASKRTATISGVTVRNGFNNNSFSPTAKGGGISNQGTLTLVECVIESNQAINISGGGVYNQGTLTLTRSTLRGNSAFLGGGLLVAGPTVIRASTLYANHAIYGGGIMAGNFGSNPSVTVVNSTISQNSADSDGGGIDSEIDTFLYNSSIIDNDADYDHDENGGTGGGIYVNSTTRVVVVNTLIARNTQMNTPTADDCHGTLELYGWNLLTSLEGCSFTGNGNTSRATINADSIGPLQDNGGPTLTHALPGTSGAVDTTSDQGCIDETGAALTTDQRGKPRPADGNNDSFARCDVGAFELQANTPPVANPQSLNARQAEAKPITLTASDADGDPLTYTVASQPAHGTLSGVAPNLTYTSTAGFSGDDHFTFKVNDGVADSSAAQVTIHVTTTPIPNSPPVANPQSVNDLSGQAKQITLTASDADGDPLTFDLVTQPAHGKLGGVAPNLTYTSTTGFTGSDHFSFKVNDGKVDSPAAQVTITIQSTTPVTRHDLYLPMTEK